MANRRDTWTPKKLKFQCVWKKQAMSNKHLTHQIVINAVNMELS